MIALVIVLGLISTVSILYIVITSQQNKPLQIVHAHQNVPSYSIPQSYYQYRYDRYYPYYKYYPQSLKYRRHRYDRHKVRRTNR